ncbi:MAG TPA: transketolase [Candidatus Dependentiae bacterium]|nr:transketolase [Candidatus Dependentiae bacterium]
MHNGLKAFLEFKAYRMRYWSIVAPSEAGSGHTTSCLSAADIMSILFFYAMQYDPQHYDNPDNDRFILSKGHASPLLYSAWREVGMLSDKDMMTYRKMGSVLEGHPTLRFPYAEAATGALGLGLSIGVGEALCARSDRRNYYTYVLMGDSETTEGAVWEAVQLGAHYKLDNLIAIIDVNRLGQSTPTLFEDNVQRYVEVFDAFNWHALLVDGHNIEQLMKVFDKAREITKKPVVIIAKTFKGRGVNMLEDKEGYHGKAIAKDKLDEALKQLANNFPQAAAYNRTYSWTPKLPEKSPTAITVERSFAKMADPLYQRDSLVPTRKAYGQALAALGSTCDAVISLDAEVKNSTYAEIFEEKHPNRFFQCFIAEQNMVGMGIGFDRRNRMPFISTFGAFFSRAHDQIRMAAIGQARLNLVGSHAGVSIGQDGPSQMALEDIAMMRAIPESVVLYPSDAVSTYKLVEQMARYEEGIAYLRTTRAATAVIYDNNEDFIIGGCKVLQQSDHDRVCIIAAGITLFEALKAYKLLQQEKIDAAIIDLYSIKPLDETTIKKIVKKANNKVVTVEDHYLEGGLGQAVMYALRNTGVTIACLAVDKLPRSGKPEELLAYEGIDASAIVQKVKEII